MKKIQDLLQENIRDDAYAPVFFRLNNDADKAGLEKLLEANPAISIHDEIYSQLCELIKGRHPSIKLTNNDYTQLISDHLGDRNTIAYGVWVYYPWNRKLVHILDEAEYKEVRTNRNQYKITQEEQELLATKKIGIIGLSVGQAIALTFAMERGFGELRLADFDTLELSNMNRIRSGIHNLGTYKVILAAREIAEIDPFLKVVCYKDGVTQENIDRFFLDGGKLDILVEECDGLDIKILSRFKAKELGIPVVMDTSDRGMIDVERFDLEPGRPILHGLSGDLDPAKLKGLSNEEKIPYIMQIVNVEKISTRLKSSFMEVDQSITTWPQLASGVSMGGAIAADVCRRILLNQFHESGRYYIDPEELISDLSLEKTVTHTPKNPFKPLTKAEIREISHSFFNTQPIGTGQAVDEHMLSQLIDAAIAAPSAGNNQPWKWYFSKNTLFLFHDKSRSWSWGDYHEMGAHMALGAALENVFLKSMELKTEANIRLFPLENEPKLIAAIVFNATDKTDPQLEPLAGGIFTRHTNRKLSERKQISSSVYEGLKEIGESIPAVDITFIDNEKKLSELGDIIAACDRIRLLHDQGHEEFYSEVRWDQEQAKKTLDGIDIASVDLTKGELAGFKVAQDWSAVKLLSDWDKGHAFEKLSRKYLKTASGALLVSIPEFNHTSLLNAGRAIERTWIRANQHGVSVYPMLSSVFFFNRLTHGKGVEIPKHIAGELAALRERFLKIFPDKTHLAHVFLMRLSLADQTTIKSLRLPKDDVFYSD